MDIFLFYNHSCPTNESLRIKPWNEDIWSNPKLSTEKIHFTNDIFFWIIRMPYYFLLHILILFLGEFCFFIFVNL